MKITEIRFKWPREGDRPNVRLRAFCAITFDECFVVHDFKIVEGDKGLFVSMPSRKLCDHCDACNGKNPLKARFCSDCGADMGEAELTYDEKGREKLYMDVCHPSTEECRRWLEDEVLMAYREEAAKLRPATVNGTPG